jgi:hypothetical protein
MQNETEFLNGLLASVYALDGVQSVGKSGGMEISQGSDIDIYVFCDRIPDTEKRQNLINSFDMIVRSTVDLFDDTFYGVGDVVYTDALEIYLMYNRIDQFADYIDSVLAGGRLEKEGGFFFPTGKCATMLKMGVFYDRNGFISSAKARLSAYPEELSIRLSAHHISRLRGSNMDSLTSAVKRKDPVEYYDAFNETMDHLFQGLFALNKVFYPGRKRNIAYMAGFARKPDNCEERIFNIITLGGRPETLGHSLEFWLSLLEDTEKLCRK